MGILTRWQKLNHQNEALLTLKSLKHYGIRVFLMILDSPAIAIIRMHDYIWTTFFMTEHLISPPDIIHHKAGDRNTKTGLGALSFTLACSECQGFWVRLPFSNNVSSQPLERRYRIWIHNWLLLPIYCNCSWVQLFNFGWTILLKFSSN